MNINYPNTECGKLIKETDWNKTSLGNIDHWPVSLKVTVNNILYNTTPQVIAWGKELVQIYNDANKYVLGDKHPQAMAQKSKDTWKSIWDEMGPLYEQTLRGAPMSFKDFHLEVVINNQPQQSFFDFTMAPLFDDDGEIGGVLITVLDTTEKMRAIAKLNQAESKLKNIIRNAPVGMAVYSGPNYVVDILNPSLAKMAGRPESEIVGKPLFEAVTEARGQGLEQVLDEVYKTNTPFTAYENKFVLPNEKGILRDIFLNFIYEPFSDDEGKVEGIIVVAVDVTEQVNARKRVEELEERNRLAIEIANIGTYDIDMITNDIITSERFDEIFGVKNATREQYVSVYHPDDKHIRDAAYVDAIKNGYTSYQVRLLLENGTLKWVKCEAKIYYDDKGNPKRLIGTVLDVTEIVLLQQHKDDFLAIASHELKTPLTSLKGYSEMLEYLIRKGDQVVSLNIIKKSQRQVDKMSKLIYTFLDISRIESAQFYLNKENFDFNELIRETINYYNVPENKERIRFVPGKIPRMDADRQKISHVIDNLVSNALKYSADHQPILIKSDSDQNSLIFSVQDLGNGIDSSSQNKIFQRFFRAENAKKHGASGFGIGLYFSAEVIKLHNGKIWFDSKEGVGSTFYFSLPRN